MWPVILLLVSPAVVGLQNAIHIGGLFHPIAKGSDHRNADELAFRYAAEMINADPSVLSNHTLMTHLEHVNDQDSFQVSRAVCKMLGMEVIGVFGPHTSDSSHHVQSICDSMDIPHIEIRPDVKLRRQDLLVNLYPHTPTLARAFVDLVLAWEWKSFTLIYEDSPGLIRLSELIKMYSFKGNTVTVRQLDPLSDNYRPVLRMIRESGEKNIIIDCAIDKLAEVLKQAQQVGLMVADRSYIITNLDMHTVDLEAFQWSGANVTGVRLVDPESHDVQMTVRWWSDRETRNRKALQFNPDTLMLSTALIHDAVYLFAKALARLDSPAVEISPLDCNSDNTWNHGSSLMNLMKDGQSVHKGLTGLIQFDNEGFRSKFEIDVIELGLDGIQKVGTWNATEGLNLTRSPPVKEMSETGLHNMSFKVVTAMAKPYGMLKEASDALIGNDRFEGFGIDLIHEISGMLGFEYTFSIQEDGKNGGYNSTTKEWDGMVRALIDKTADLAIVDLTITAERESAVDFTMPFMNLGISIVYKSPTKEPPKLFSFLSTFSPGVWYTMLAAYTGVSLVMFVTGRISPKEWTNPYPCIAEPDELENQFNLKNAFWFTIGSLMQQGSEIAPIAISTRMIAGIWWFFTLIMVSSYTANLAAVLTIESMSSPFKTVEELANKGNIKYGAKKGGSTANFFRDSTYEVYQRMWQFMDSHPEVWTNSNDEGIERVKTQNYAYFMESTSIEYIIERDCKVTQIGGMLDNKGYGIAMRKNSTYRNALSTAVLKLQETGKLAKLKNRWWKEERGGGACADAGGGSGADQLSLAHVGGVFVVLVSGVALAIVFTFIELVYDVSTTAYKEKIPFAKLLMEEFKFIIRCRGSTKPVHKYNSSDDGDGDDAQTNGNEEFAQVTQFESGFKQRLT